MSTISAIIPNFNGRLLLEKHLPVVLEAMRSGDELVIIDDRSTDSSWEWLSDQFSTVPDEIETFDGFVERGTWNIRTKRGSVLLLQNRLNLRFAMTCNAAVVQASHDLVYLLNSDVSPSLNTIESLVIHFADPKVFAVGCLEHERNEGKDVKGGKNVLTFGRGMFAHQRAASFESGETAWASGGSSMFDRQKWLELRGFDDDYYPAYWEDVDLAFRAKKRGWKILFDRTAEVVHNHESTNISTFGQMKMTKMSWQHAQTFVAKNGSWKQKLQYLMWQPYWWIKGPTIAPLQLQILFFGLILLIATLLRFNKLAEVPHGMTWDEAAIAYNGWSVTTTGRDEWLKKLPISFRSFGDYKAPLAIYIVGAFTRVFNMELLAVRLPFAIAGVAAVLGMMILTRQLWAAWMPKRKITLFPVLDASCAALLVGALMATSAWHIHYSRIGFESGMALSFLIWGVIGITWLINKYQTPSTQIGMLIRGVIGLCSASLIAASLYTYHSSKIVTPLILILIACLFFNRLFKNWKFVVGWCLVVGFLLLPLAVDSFFGNGADRFQQSTIFRLGLAPLDTVSTLVQHFFIHFAPSYLIHGETETLRHGSGSFGILYVSEFFLIVIGFLGFLFNWIRARSNLIPHVSKLFLFSLAWILVGILPAIIGIDVPHSNRMLLAMPGFLLMAALGWQWIAEKFTDGLVAPSILGMTLLFQVFFVSSYLNHYYTSFSKYSADDFIDGYADTVRYVVQHEDEVDNVIFTSAYQQPYIYTLIGRKTNIYQYHNGALIKYLFPDFITAGDLLRVRALIVATPEEIDPRVGDKLIYGSDGEVRFVIVKTKQ